MRFIYPAVITKMSENCFRGEFPDLMMCKAEGDSLDDCLRNCNLAVYDWIDLEMQEDEPLLPPVTPKEELEMQYRDRDDVYVRNILTIYRMKEGWDE